ncbi:MAG: UDP-N-acetylmuramoyl-L-alanine--D-glutamate ligase [Pseudomonadota bacterium]|mgnify:CR=1 FL=1
MIKRDLPNLIVGLGKTGLSCARFLARRGEEFAAIDSRANPPELAVFRREFPEAAVHLGGFDPMVIFRAQRLIVSPGVALSEAPITAAVNRGAEAVGDIELFAHAARAPVVAITGANGKSTVTTLVGEMAADAGRQVRVGGNLGTPALDLIEENAPDVYVLELSSFQLETTTSLNAAAATVLNLSPDHMDRYRDMDEYAAAKARIYRGDGVMVINADDPLVAAMAQRGRRITRFSLSAPAGEDFGVVERAGQAWLARGATLLMSAAELRIKGAHNIANALAALALGAAVDLPMDGMLATLRRFAGLPHRTQWVATRDGVTWYNDSKGTNVGATLAALQGMPGKVVLIAGGLGKGQDFSLLKDAAAAKARAVVLLGRDAPLIEQALAGVVPVVNAASMEEAVLRARDLARAGDTVLLSPACASFDMFKSYDHRGDVFSAAVRSMPA